MVTWDATYILATLEPENCVPRHLDTGKPVERFSDRLEFLIATLEEANEKIVIPTPALSEILVLAGNAGTEYLQTLKSSARFRVVDFDSRAAIQHAAITNHAINTGDKRAGSKESWAKIKFDRQIVSIAKVEGCKVIYSDDAGVRKFGEQNGITVIRIADLPLPPTNPQDDLFENLQITAQAHNEED